MRFEVGEGVVRESTGLNTKRSEERDRSAKVVY